MQLTFVGVGDACDGHLGNTSVLLSHGGKFLLVDAGFAVPARFFELFPNPNTPDYLYFTHWHADHIFGAPGLVVRWYDYGRTAPLTVIGQPGTEARFRELLELAYPGLYPELGFRIDYIDRVDPVTVGPFGLEFALTLHGIPNYGVRVTVDETRIGISGDGAMTDASRELFSKCTVLVHEAYTVDGFVAGHTSASVVVDECRRFLSLSSLYLVHIQSPTRRAHGILPENYVGPGAALFQVAIPQPGMSISYR